MNEETATDYASKLNAKAAEFGSPCIYKANRKGLAWVVQCWFDNRLFWEQG